MGKKEGSKKSFWVYFGVLLLILIAAIGIIFGIMFFAPQTNILGFQYFYFEDSKTKDISRNLIPNTGKKVIKINSNGVRQVNVLPSSELENIKVQYNRSCSGFIKTKESRFEFKDIVLDQAFDTEGVKYSILELTIYEPEMWSVSGASVVNVYLPNKFSADILYVEASSCDINIDMHDEITEESITTEYYYDMDDLYVNTGSDGNVTINQPHAVKNYNLKTANGNMSINDNRQINAESMTIESNRGVFDYTNTEGTAEISLTRQMKLVSRNSYGPTIKIDKLISNLECDLNGGNINIKEIGKEGFSKSVISTSTKSKFDINKMYGYVSFIGNSQSLSNNIKFGSIINQSQYKSNFTIGNGNLYVGELTGTGAFNSGSGNITVSNIDVTSNIYVISDSGNINISYKESPTHHKDVITNIFTNSGDVVLTNISSMLYVNVFNDSKDSLLDVTFMAISYQNTDMPNNIINAGNRDIVLRLKGIGNDLIFRMACQHENVTTESVLVEKINAVDNDAFLNKMGFDQYSHSYRIGYNDPNNLIYSGKGLLLINKSSAIIFKAA